jgi:galactokinase/mevalonate kinase-like predicted kinase
VLLPDSLWYELERRLVLIFLGKSHHSSGVHKLVIERLQKVKQKQNKKENEQTKRKGDELDALLENLATVKYK